MKTIKILLKLLIMSLLINSSAMAMPAVQGVRTFTQPDGTQFEGVLKGNAQFNWIESNGEIVKYNPTDKNYYKIKKQ